MGSVRRETAFYAIRWKPRGRRSATRVAPELSRRCKMITTYKERMMSRYVSMSVATIVAVICCSAKADDVSGRIGDSATWSGTIVVTKTVTVAPAAVLTIRFGDACGPSQGMRSRR